MSPLDGVLDRVGDFKKTSNGYLALCSAHQETDPSLSISESDDGKVLLHCFAGCSIDEILDGMELTKADLFPKMGKVIPFNRPGFTLAQYAEAKKLPVDFLQSLELATVKYQNTEAVRIPYIDANGELAAVRYRLALSGDDRFRWRTGTKPCLYGLWRLNPKPDYIVLVEGESDCHTLWFHNIPAIGVPGASNWREERDAPLLDGIPIIYVIVEPDRGGDTVKQWLEKSKIRDRVRLVSLGGAHE